MYKGTLVAIIYVLLLAGCRQQQKVKITARKDIYKELIDAVNTGDSNKIKSQIIKCWSNNLIGKNDQWLHTDLNYWLAVHREFGPLSFVNYGFDTYNENEIAWYKGDITKDWIGFEFDFNEKNKITRTNVLRSCSPTNSKSLLDIDSLKIQSKQLTAYFEKLIDHDLFSGMALVAKGDSILFEYYGGYENKKQGKPITPNSSMVIASTTKMFTAVAIAQLLEDDKINIETPIAKYLPQTPEQISKKVTVANLLSHSSGIELDDLDGFMKEIARDTSVNDFYQTNLKYLSKISNFESFEPNGEFDYSNENFDFLGKLIEVASGKSYFQYLEDHIFSPLAMDKTGPIDLSQNQSNLAVPYQINRSGNGEFDNKLRDSMPYSPLRMSRPAGSFKSNVQDLYKFMYGLNHDKLIADSIKQEFTSKKIPNLTIPIYKSWYGYGFYVNERNGNLNYGHAGGIPGVSSRCEYYPKQDIYIITISNYNGSANMVANHLSTLVDFF